VALHRVACQLNYFHTVATQGFDKRPGGNIVIQRYAVDGSVMPSFAEADQTFEPDDVVISTTTFIEDATECEAHVDFANKQLHIGTIIASCTQEEVLFSIRPDLFLTLMCVETLLDNEAIVVRGCPRYCKYTGYLNSFRWAGPHPEATTPSAQVPDIIAIDSVVNKGVLNQFRENTRDLRKCFGGFSVWDEPDTLSSLQRYHGKPYKAISTGKWGCGVFGGDNTLKFLQHLLVAVASPHRKRLKYCCFGSADLAAALETLFAAICHKQMQVRDVYRAIQEFAMESRRDAEFHGYMEDYVKRFTKSS
jgi:poly(ADP-ribose) glycohydrolase